ncbi:MAG TPA: hypothetical protein VKD43_19345 [Xanthobacteraceae bacterium]|nr:hypothetical protein [Xanthobacteraceae bacterium]
MGSATEPSVGQDLAWSMVERITGTTSHAEALRMLRSAYPESPLTVRVLALALLSRRAANNSPHIPR